MEIQYLHPHSLESAMTIVCRISPSPFVTDDDDDESVDISSMLSSASKTVSHRSKEDIASMVQDNRKKMPRQSLHWLDDWLHVSYLSMKWILSSPVAKDPVMIRLMGH